MAQRITAANEVFQAVADPTRRASLDLLKSGVQSAGEIADSFSVSRPAVSKHLRLLKNAQLVTESRTGRRRIYQLSGRPLSQVDDWLSGYRRFWQQSLTRLKGFAESQERKRKTWP